MGRRLSRTRLHACDSRDGEACEHQSPSGVGVVLRDVWKRIVLATIEVPPVGPNQSPVDSLGMEVGRQTRLVIQDRAGPRRGAMNSHLARNRSGTSRLKGFRDALGTRNRPLKPE